ncbi:NGG1 interacting factor [Physocladia obscura]|uniref:Peroxidase n=1 Tax=Physocladia obscura TaxID=109957 RepID=A0AAD5T3X3_9FUNG|nr:NGG1 interacting factor [Physocladia obscura]
MKLTFLLAFLATASQAFSHASYYLSEHDLKQASGSLAYEITGKNRGGRGGGCLFALPDSPHFPSRNLAALWLQSVFHDSGTWDDNDGTGGLNGSLEKELGKPFNTAIAKAIATKARPPGNRISNADIIALGGVVAVEICGGPPIDYHWGRWDSERADRAISELPTDPFMPVCDVQKAFERMGLDAVDMLALVSGSHSMGGAHKCLNPKITNHDFEPFDATPDVFDNEIFKRILTGNCVLPIDCAFAKEEHLLPYIKEWAHDQESFFRQFKKSFEKLLNFNRASLSGPVGVIVETPVPRAEATRVFLTIDVTATTLDEALADAAVGVVVAYHPPLFTATKKFVLGDERVRLALLASAHGVSLVSPHTTVDNAGPVAGINEWLASVALPPLQSILPISPLDKLRLAALSSSDFDSSVPLGAVGAGRDGRVAVLAQSAVLSDIIERIKKNLNLSHLRVALPKRASNYDSFSVNVVAICVGSGGQLTSQALNPRPDLILTGEMAHHEVLAATANGSAVILCEHSNSERGFLKDILAPLLQRVLNEDSYSEHVEVVISSLDSDPLVIV